MKAIKSVFLSMATLLTLSTFAVAQSTAFTYQGRLTDGTSPANNLYEMQFTLFDAATNGNLVGAPVTLAPVPVTNGLFTVSLDLGASAFSGAPRWLEITLNLYGSDMVPITLSPRQPITATPYALLARGLAPMGTNPNTLPAFRIEAGTESPNIIGGYYQNAVSNAVYGAVIAGGGGLLAANVAAGNFATVSGGGGNQALAYSTTVAGGQGNTAGAFFDTVSGGEANIADGMWSAVGGGGRNHANGTASFIGGGYANTTLVSEAAIAGGVGNIASGQASAIPGGRSNVTYGAFSFVGGYRAKNIGDGSFVWADHTEHDFECRSANQFLVRATSGVQFVTGLDADGASSAGVSLASGSGAWSSLSDRNAKTNLVSVDARATLDKVAALPLATWNYKSQDRSIRHIGPTAQDFHAAFDVGENDHTITTIDADGVALAAIQGLNQKLEEKEARIRELEKAVAELKMLVTQTRTPKQ